jgi:hypothetical protein
MSQLMQRRRRHPDSFAQEQLLLSARAAAQRLGVNPRTVQKRAARAMVAGPLEVQTIAGSYVAPLSWWVELLTAEPIRRGRPRLAFEASVDDEIWHWECMIGCPGDPEYDAAVREQQLARRRYLYRQRDRAAARAAVVDVGE